MSPVDPGAVFLGKVLAVFAQLLALEVALLVGLVAVYGYDVQHPFLLVASALAASLGIASVGLLLRHPRRRSSRCATPCCPS